MYLSIDIGGTKTLLATFTNQGKIIEQIKFPTPQLYRQFIREVATAIASLTLSDVTACCVAAPGKINRTTGEALAFGNLEWKFVPLKKDIENLVKCPILIENDANLAGLSEAIALKNEFNRVLYVTVSTGIGTGIVFNQTIAPEFQDSEGGQIILEHQGKLTRWEDFASGSAIVRRFGKRAEAIHDAKTWRIIAKDLSTGLVDLSAILQPEVIVIGGGVGNYFDRFSEYLLEEMHVFDTPLTPTPTLRQALHPNEAVIMGCYHLLKAHESRTNATA